MKLHYFSKPNDAGRFNFGDELNPWLWPKLAPDLFHGYDSKLFVGIGTILTSDLLRQGSGVVFGSGAGYCGELIENPAADCNLEFVCVRGPRTANLLSLPKEKAVTDPAILVRRVRPELVERRNDGYVLFVPHWKSPVETLAAISAKVGVEVLDPTCDVDTCLEKISRAKLVLAEAMHAAVIADAFRVPWLPVSSGPAFNLFKWSDWADSLEIGELRPRNLYWKRFSTQACSPGSIGGRVAEMICQQQIARLSRQKGILSNRTVSDRKELQLVRLLSQLQDAERNN